MKRITAVLLLIMLLFTACGKSTEPSVSQSNSVTESESQVSGSNSYIQQEPAESEVKEAERGPTDSELEDPTLKAAPYFRLNEIRDVEEISEYAENYKRFSENYTDKFKPDVFYTTLLPYEGRSGNTGSFYGIYDVTYGIICDPVFYYEGFLKVGEYYYYFFNVPYEEDDLPYYANSVPGKALCTGLIVRSDGKVAIETGPIYIFRATEDTIYTSQYYVYEGRAHYLDVMFDMDLNEIAQGEINEMLTFKVEHKDTSSEPLPENIQRIGYQWLLNIDTHKSVPCSLYHKIGEYIVVSDWGANRTAIYNLNLNEIMKIAIDDNYIW